MILAHGFVAPGSLWGAWSLDPLIIGGVLLLAGLHLIGVRKLRRAAPRGMPLRRALAFHAGLAVLLVALVSPLAVLGETIFSAHMVQHLVLMLVVAPLLVYGSPAIPAALALPGRWRRVVHLVPRSRAVRVVRSIAINPIVAWSLGAAVLWAWHLPGLYQAALRARPLHALEHATFLLSALLFWWLLIQSQARRRMSYGIGVLFVFATTLQSACLGVVLLFATDALYPIHALGASAWGLTPLQDQQLAGALMWVPPGFVYLFTMSVLFVKWLKDIEERMKRTEAMQPALAPVSKR